MNWDSVERFITKLINKRYAVPALILGVVVLILGALTFRQPPGKPLAPPSPELIGFYEKGFGTTDPGWPSLQSHYRYFGTVCPFWYSLHASGDIETIRLEPHVRDFLMSQKGLKVIPLINNADGNDKMLTDPEVRKRAIKNITDLVVNNKYHGINIDFQGIPAKDKDNYTAFVKELAASLHPKGKMVTLSVFPKVDVSHDVSGAFDYKALAQYVDWMAMMTYDNHSETSGPGSVAPIDWVERNIKYALSQGVPREKLVMTVASYGYDWPVGKGKAINAGIKDLHERARERGASIRWDDSSQSSFFRYTANDGSKREVWFEDGKAAAAKAALARKYGLRGVAVWRLGFEDPAYFHTVVERLRR